MKQGWELELFSLEKAQERSYEGEITPNSGGE